MAEAASADVVSVELTAKRQVVRIAPGVKMKAWAFNGIVPGPVIRAREGDTIAVTVHNADTKMAHSVDFHAAQISPQTGFADVLPGETKTFSFVARRPGVFMYHCGTSPVLQHIGMGMYGAIIVDPAAGRPPARETVLVQSEFYGPVEDGRIRPTYGAMRTESPTYAAFNGRAFRYRDKPIEVAVGEPQRVYVVAAGPTLGSDFHIVGEIFDRVEADGTRSTGSRESRPTACQPAARRCSSSASTRRAATRSSPTRSAGPMPARSGSSRQADAASHPVSGVQRVRSGGPP